MAIDKAIVHDSCNPIVNCNDTSHELALVYMISEGYYLQDQGEDLHFNHEMLN
jgi:hypothetical protein